jgi:hypothetical protein
MTWVVAVSDRAQKNLSRAPAADERRILAALDAMQIDPLSGMLSGSPARSPSAVVSAIIESFFASTSKRS